MPKTAKESVKKVVKEVGKTAMKVAPIVAPELALVKELVQALRPHQSKPPVAAAGVGYNSAPTSLGAMVQSVPYKTKTHASGNGVVVSGRAYLGPVLSRTTGFTLGLSSGANPAMLPDRIATIARTYESYRYLKARLVYIPIAPTSTSGQVALCVADEYADLPASTLGQVYDLPRMSAGPVWQPNSVSVGPPTRTYYTDYAAHEDPKEHEQFRFEVYCTGSSAVSVWGHIMLEYEIELTSICPTPLTFSGNAGYQTCVGTTTGVTVTFDTFSNGVNITSDDAGITIPTRSTTGRIFEFTFYQAWNATNITVGAVGSALLAGKGPFRVWGVLLDSGKWNLYITLVGAMSGANNATLVSVVATAPTLVGPAACFIRPVDAPTPLLTN